MVDYGRNTKGYQLYIKTVPKDQRASVRKDYPTTPDIYRKCSKRAFDGLVREWRIALHKWDPPEGGAGEDEEKLTQADADVATEELANLDAELAKEVEAEVAAAKEAELAGDEVEIDLNDDEVDVLVNLDDDDDDGVLVSLDILFL